MDKFTNLADALASDYTVFNEGGYVKNEMWIGTIEVLKIFLSSNTNAFSQLEAEARRDTGDLNIFNPSYEKTASREQLRKWIRSTWSTISNPTPFRRLARVITEVLEEDGPPDNDLPHPVFENTLQILGDSLSGVNTLFGKNVSIITPVTIPSDQSVVSASVDISCIMASFLTAARFEKSNQKLWAALDRLEIINALFPTEGADPELGVKTAISKLTKLRQVPG